jgi:hypothetical protein
MCLDGNREVLNHVPVVEAAGFNRRQRALDKATAFRTLRSKT